MEDIQLHCIFWIY